MSEVPLIWTTKGNVPVESLRYETRWEDNPDYMKLTESYYDGDELVKQSAHIYSKRGLDTAALLQPLA